MPPTQTDDETNVKSRQREPTANCDRPIRFCVIVTVDITLLNLCRGRFEYLAARGFDITAVCAPTPHAEELKRRGIRLVTAPLTRAITPLQDLAAIWRLFRFLRRERFDLVEVSTPKAALVGSIAAWLARVPCVVHLLRGLVYDQARGLQRWLLRLSQTVPCRVADEVISISKEMMEQTIRDGLCAPQKIRVLGGGSSNGIDLKRFSPPSTDEHRHLRESYGIPADAIIAGFVGRMTRDKGIHELVRAFAGVAAKNASLHLVLVGDYEERDRPAPDVIETVSSHPRIHTAGWQHDTAPFFAAIDILILPTYREGFGTVLLEGAAMGLPVITTDIVGCRDAVEAGETAILVPPRNTAALAEALERLAGDEALRAKLGRNGRRRAEVLFAQETVWAMQAEAFQAALAAKRGRQDARPVSAKRTAP